MFGGSTIQAVVQVHHAFDPGDPPTGSGVKGHLAVGIFGRAEWLTHLRLYPPLSTLSVCLTNAGYNDKNESTVLDHKSRQ